jgi:hypothetical protein
LVGSQKYGNNLTDPSRKKLTRKNIENQMLLANNAAASDGSNLGKQFKWAFKIRP